MPSSVTGAGGTPGSKTDPALLGLPVESGGDRRKSKQRKKESPVVGKVPHCRLGVSISGRGVHACLSMHMCVSAMCQLRGRTAR